MDDAQRLAEAKRLILLAMDQLSRVADANEGKDLGEWSEDAFVKCAELCQAINAMTRRL